MVALILVEKSVLPCPLEGTLTLIVHSGRPNEMHKMNFFIHMLYLNGFAQRKSMLHFNTV